MSGRIGDDELAPVGGEEAIRHVNRDALLAFGRQSVHEQREVDVVAARAAALRVGLQRRQLILEDGLAFVEEPPDEGRLAVVHAAAGDEAQQGLLLVRLQVAFDVRRNELRRG